MKQIDLLTPKYESESILNYSCMWGTRASPLDEGVGMGFLPAQQGQKHGSERHQQSTEPDP